MPHLTIPTSPDGPIVDAVFGITGKGTAALQAARQPIPAPVAVRALVDTGTDVSCVAPWVLRQLGLVPSGSSSTHTAGGSVKVQLFNVSLTIWGPAGKAGPSLVRDPLKVMEFAHAPPTIEALIGTDVLAECLLIIDGPAQHFILAF